MFSGSTERGQYILVFSSYAGIDWPDKIPDPWLFYAAGVLINRHTSIR